MKNYVCLFAALFLWCALMPTLMPLQLEGQAATEELEDADIDIRYFDGEEKVLKHIGLEEYVAKALSVLMEADTPQEALKAQAVAIRSVVCYRYEHPEHQGYELCSDPGHCFTLPSRANSAAIEASNATRGEVLTYNGTAALALSHRSSKGKTESYETVFGSELAYLKSTKVYNEGEFSDHKQVLCLEANAFSNAFSEYSVNLSGDIEGWIGNKEYTDSGRVYTIEVGGLCFKGSTFARLLGLQSTCFEVEATEKGFTVSCYGVGNGVGMSRYTAILMAKEGKNYREIIDYFYKGTQVSLIKSE